ncbi:hypothetical protein II906_04330, partial [bacterium]|nr:hypothetical protein [bacterium]
MKKIVYSLIFIALSSAVADAAVTLDNVLSPKKPAYRLGVSYDIEKEYKVVDIKEKQEQKTAAYEKTNIRNSTYADSTLKDLSNEISKLLSIEKEDMLEHIQILWTGA